MPRLFAILRFALAEFGPLIVFWTLAATLEVKPAILGSILFIAADAAWRRVKRLKFTRLYLLISPEAPALCPRAAHDDPIRRSSQDARRRRRRRRQGQTSRIYRSAALIIMLWGVVNIVRDALIAISPAWFGSRWFLIDAIGAAGTIVILSMSAVPSARLPLRTLAAFLLFYAFGWIWADLIGDFTAASTSPASRA